MSNLKNSFIFYAFKNYKIYSLNFYNRMEVQENNIALMVDSIGDIMAFDAQELVLPPTHLSGQFQDAIQGAYKLSNGLLIILDTAAISRNAQNPHGIVASLQSLPTSL